MLQGKPHQDFESFQGHSNTCYSQRTSKFWTAWPQANMPRQIIRKHTRNLYLQILDYDQEKKWNQVVLDWLSLLAAGVRGRRPSADGPQPIRTKSPASTIAHCLAVIHWAYQQVGLKLLVPLVTEGLPPKRPTPGQRCVEWPQWLCLATLWVRQGHCSWHEHNTNTLKTRYVNVFRHESVDCRSCTTKDVGPRIFHLWKSRA